MNKDEPEEEPNLSPLSKLAWSIILGVDKERCEKIAALEQSIKRGENAIRDKKEGRPI